jgi:transcription-repair coupling factor (superfamily II helicase)
MGAPRIRDLELVAWVAGLLLALDGREVGEVDITTFIPATRGTTR